LQGKYIFKIIIVGDEAVGKTCLVKRYSENIFPIKSYQTIGVDFSIKELSLDDKLVKLQIWDFGGQEHYRHFQYSFCEGSDGAIISFDLSNPNSCNNLEKWQSFIKESLSYEIPTVLVGTKSDIKSKDIDWKKILKYSKKYNVKYFETSAKENISVEPPFYFLSKLIFRKYNQVKPALITV
jgi:small GTP-binding protein